MFYGNEYNLLIVLLLHCGELRAVLSATLIWAMELWRASGVVGGVEVRNSRRCLRLPWCFMGGLECSGYLSEISLFLGVEGSFFGDFKELLGYDCGFVSANISINLKKLCN
jgi:hypothetical protein